MGKGLTRAIRVRGITASKVHAEKGDLAHLEGETSNALFEELANWNHQLQDNNVQFEEPSP